MWPASGACALGLPRLFLTLSRAEARAATRAAWRFGALVATHDRALIATDTFAPRAHALRKNLADSVPQDPLLVVLRRGALRGSYHGGAMAADLADDKRHVFQGQRLDVAWRSVEETSEPAKIGHRSVFLTAWRRSTVTDVTLRIVAGRGATCGASDVVAQNFETSSAAGPTESLRGRAPRRRRFPLALDDALQSDALQAQRRRSAGEAQPAALSALDSRVTRGAY